MSQIAAVIFPGRKVDFPPILRKVRPPSSGWSGFSPPMKTLVNEHTLITRLLALVPWISALLDRNPQAGRQAAAAALDFIRIYADRFHHAKEEDILFACFDPELEVLKSMHGEHEMARGHVKAAAAALESGDDASVAANLSAYRDLLTQHIRKEDEVLYPFLDSRLTTTQVGQMFQRFAAIEKEFGETPRRLERTIAAMEEQSRVSRGAEPAHRAD